jgi:SAM-dependent methyltransferase
MNTHIFACLLCPFCQESLEQREGVLVCSRSHTFDLAREGYVYLLRKKGTGDTREMLAARRAFLARGYYRPIAELINSAVTDPLEQAGHSQQADPVMILDAGCGEGYYLGQLQEHLRAHQFSAACVGLDSSKEAVRLAARSSADTFGVVASLNERLPFKDGSFQVILNVFAPHNPLEFARVIAPGGLLLVVFPAPSHLQELRSALHLLNIEEHKEQHIIAQLTAQGAFHLERRVAVTAVLHLQGPEITQLVMMTPNYWHLDASTLQAMSGIERMTTRLACRGLVFRASMI